MGALKVSPSIWSNVLSNGPEERADGNHDHHLRGRDRGGSHTTGGGGVEARPSSAAPCIPLPPPPLVPEGPLSSFFPMVFVRCIRVACRCKMGTGCYQLLPAFCFFGKQMPVSILNKDRGLPQLIIPEHITDNVLVLLEGRKLFGSVGPNWKYTQEAVHLCIITIASIRRARVIRSAGVAPPFPGCRGPSSQVPDGPRQAECTDSNAKMCRDCETELAPVGDICRKGNGRICQPSPSACRSSWLKCQMSESRNAATENVAPAHVECWWLLGFASFEETSVCSVSFCRQAGPNSRWQRALTQRRA